MPHDEGRAPFLLPHHQKMLDDSQIDPALQQARGYRSIVDKEELRRYGFHEHQRRVPCLLIPSYNIYGRLDGYSIRPDRPRTNDAGKPVKYDRPPNSKNFLDVNPAMPREWLENVNQPIIITEGARKVDAGLSQGFVVVGVFGVWGWRTRENGSSVVITDLKSIPIMGREVYPGYDSDAITKPEVYQAQLELGMMLTQRGAIVKYLRIPEGPEGEKQGLDDFLQHGGSIEDLIRDADVDPLEPPDLRSNLDKYDFWAYGPTNRYISVSTGIHWVPESINKQIRPVPVAGGQTIKAADWLAEHRSVQQITWAPGEEQIIEGRVIGPAGWEERPDQRVFNTYRAPRIPEIGDPLKAKRWLDHIEFLYPDDVQHLVSWLAFKVQRPGVKINHALLLGGKPGIGKDTIVQPVMHAVGPGNFKDVTPNQTMSKFNAYLKHVIVRVSELRDLGETNRFGFYEHMKIYIAAPPDYVQVEEKYMPAGHIPNVCGIVYTTNNETDGLYLPPDDRRHFVTWSARTPDEVSPDYFNSLYHWLDFEEGNEHVAALLRTWDLSGFDPKAPPPKTAAFWNVVDAGRAPEESELETLLDELNWPEAITVPMLVGAANRNSSSFEKVTGFESDFAQWLKDRKNKRQVPHRLESVGYVSVRNPDAQNGLWTVAKQKVKIYVKAKQTRREQLDAANELVSNAKEAAK